MLQEETKVNIIDSSTIHQVKVIRILKKKKKAFMGDIVITSIKKKEPKSPISSKVLKSFIMSTKFRKRRLNNFYIQSATNSAIMLSNQNKIISARFKGPFFKEIYYSTLNIEGLSKLKLKYSFALI